MFNNFQNKIEVQPVCINLQEMFHYKIKKIKKKEA
jgi:uncharacterized protein (UPF0179 family)